MYPHTDDNDFDDIQSRIYKLLPKQTQDIFATFIFLVLMPASFFFYVFGVMPTWFPAFGEAWVIRVSLMGFLAFNTYVNWYRMMKTTANGNNPDLPNVVKAGFRYCHSCHTNAPPRAYHCPVCDKCHFRRDHHCSFGGVCVGHFNQRFFVGAILNLWVLTAVLTSYSWDFLWLQMDGPLTIGKVWQLFLPHVALILRFLSFTQFLCCIFFSSTFCVLGFVTYLIAAQAFCLWHGQTRVEYLLDIHAYQLGLRENIRQSLGTRWFLIALSPFIPSPLPSDGMSFVTREIATHTASTKNM